MEITAPVMVIIVTNAVVWLIQFVALKTDTRWIREWLKKNGQRLDRHEQRLNAHQAQISSVQTGCAVRHSRTTFPSVDNGVDQYKG